MKRQVSFILFRGVKNLLGDSDTYVLICGLVAKIHSPTFGISPPYASLLDK